MFSATSHEDEETFEDAGATTRIGMQTEKDNQKSVQNPCMFLARFLTLRRSSGSLSALPMPNNGCRKIFCQSARKNLNSEVARISLANYCPRLWERYCINPLWRMSFWIKMPSSGFAFSFGPSAVWPNDIWKRTQVKVQPEICLIPRPSESTLQASPEVCHRYHLLQSVVFCWQRISVAFSTDRNVHLRVFRHPCGRKQIG